MHKVLCNIDLYKMPKDADLYLYLISVNSGKRVQLLREMEILYQQM